MKQWRIFSIFLPALLILFLLSCRSNPISSIDIKPDERGYLVKIGDKSPDFSMNFIDGSTKKLSDFRGKVVVLQFTASWCKVCREEMPHLENEVWLPNKHKDFILIGIDRDEPLEKVKKFIEQTKVSYPISLDENADIFGLFADKKSGVTRNVVIDKKGKIVHLTRLFEQSEFEEMKETITRIL